MKQIIAGDAADDIIGPWIFARTGGQYVRNTGRGFGLLEDGKLVAGVWYEQYNGASVLVHVAAEGKRWLSRNFLLCCFQYPFEQLQVKRITGLVAASNAEARRFDEHLGFKLEATLKDAHPTGDLLVYAMHRADCKWLSLKDRHETQSRAPIPPESRISEAA